MDTPRPQALTLPIPGVAAALLTIAPPALRAQRPAAPLSSMERAVVRAIDQHNGEALALLERAVNINSGTLNFAGVRQVADLLRPQLDALGFTTRWVDGASFHRAAISSRNIPDQVPRSCSLGISTPCSSPPARSSTSSAARTPRPTVPG